MRAISGDADFSILGRTPTISETLYPRVLADPGVAGAWPLYRLDVALAGRDEIYLQILGLDLFAPMQIPWRETPETTSSPLWDPGWAAVSPELAARQGWRVGDPFEVSSGSRRTTLQVGALVDFRRTSPLANSRMVVMDIAQAQSAFGGRGVIHQIDVQVREGSDPDQVKRRLARALGPAVQLLTPEQRRQEASGLLGAFRLNLTALSLVSLFVGGFLIYSSTQASLVRRRNEFGLLRSVGTTRGQMLGLILGEVALLGAIGVLLGLPLGYGVASLSVERVSGTLTNLYLLEEIETLQLPALALRNGGGHRCRRRAGGRAASGSGGEPPRRAIPAARLHPAGALRRRGVPPVPARLSGAGARPHRLPRRRPRLASGRLRPRRDAADRPAPDDALGRQADDPGDDDTPLRAALRHEGARPAPANHLLRRRRPGRRREPADRHHTDDRQLPAHRRDLDQRHGERRRLHHHRVLGTGPQRGHTGRRPGARARLATRRGADGSAAAAPRLRGRSPHLTGRGRHESVRGAGPVRADRRRSGERRCGAAARKVR